MGAPKKATKKFEKNHLKGVLERRKAVAKIKQRAQNKVKRQARRDEDADFLQGSEANGTSTPAPSKKKRLDAKVSSMSVDDFFQGGFQIVDDAKEKETKETKKTKKTKKEKKTTESPKLGKRKRNGAKKEEEDDEDEDDDSEPVPEAVENDSDSEGDGDDDDEDLGMSKAAMEALAENDPEFYKFLKENDPKVLEFDENENADLAEVAALSEGEDEEEDDDDDDDEERPSKKRKGDEEDEEEGEEEEEDDEVESKRNEPTAGLELTQEMVAKWVKSMEETHSLRAARQIVLAFRSAAHVNEDEDANGRTKQRYAIKSPEVFHDVLVAALKQIPQILQHHLPVKETAAHKTYVATKSANFSALSLLVRSFTASVLHLLTTLSDDGTLQLTLSALTPLTPYLLSFRKLLKNVIKSVVGFWAQPASGQATRITAFLVLRRLVVIGDKGVREVVLKATYQGLVQGCRATSANTIGGINLMKNSAAELWGLDPAIGYTTAFVAIRQLAVHLRNSIVRNQNRAFRVVYNWQYVHSLDFWSRVLAAHCSEADGENQLRLLVYPLVQVTLGAIRLIPTALYFPLRFQLVRALLRVSQATGTYIPLAPVLLEVLQSADMKKPGKQPGKKISTKILDFSVAYKAPTSALRTLAYQTAVGDQVVDLLGEFFALWSTNIAFPELALPVLIQLKRWLKEARKQKKSNHRVVSGLVLLVQKIEANATFVEQKRAHVDFAPRNRAQVDAFLKDFAWQKTPVGAYVVTQRKLNEEKQRLLEETRKAEAQQHEEQKRVVETDGFEEEESEEEEDDDEEEEDDE